MLDTKKLLLEFSAKTGVAGAESKAAEYGEELLTRYGKVSRTPLGSLVCTVWEKEGAPHLLLDAHMDEIGMIVTYIEDSGFLRVAGCGGMDRRIVLAAPVTVHGCKGPVRGVVCSTPPHLSKGEAKNPKIDEIYIDIGLDKESAVEAISPGDRVTISAPSRPLLGDQVSGKAIDDRAGCVSLLCALEYLKDTQPTCSLSVLFSSMEEVGGQGAKTAAFQVNPTHAIAVDVSFAHTPDAAREKCGLIGQGPMIGIAPILDNAMTDKLFALAKQEDIPSQPEVMGGRTGTNADSIVTTRGGVATGLISIPQKYMHTPIETVTVSDVENTGKLIAAYIRSLGEKEGQAHA